VSESSQGKEPPKSGWARLGEVGPAWISAITGLILALTSAGFFVGHVTASGHPQPNVTITVTKTVPASGLRASPSDTASSPASSDTASSLASNGTYLTQLTPLEAGCCGIKNSPVQMGTHTYTQSVSFGCGAGAAEVQTVVYDVAGYRYLNATIGVPNDANNNSGGTADIILSKNGSSTPLGPPISGAVGEEQRVHVNLQGAAQLYISCSGALVTVALGNAVLSAT
jgi:hypothetical protein